MPTGKANPAILYGYGGFAHIDTPKFMKKFVPWIERCGILPLPIYEAMRNLARNGTKEALERTNKILLMTLSPLPSI